MIFEWDQYQKALAQAATRASIVLSSEQEALMLNFVERLLLVNENLNLTRITEPFDLAVKHLKTVGHCCL